MISVSVTFSTTTQQYSYLVPESWNVAVGDTLVVDSPRTGHQCVTVRSIDRTGTTRATKRAVSKVDLSEWRVYQAQEQRTSHLITEANNYLDNFRRNLTMDALAAQDNGMRLILDELQRSQEGNQYD